jgi:hypothetical protein
MPVTTVVASNITVWPLLFSGQLTTGFKSKSNSLVKININNLNGALMLSNTSAIQKGYNTISINKAQTRRS